MSGMSIAMAGEETEIDNLSPVPPDQMKPPIGVERVPCHLSPVVDPPGKVPRSIGSSRCHRTALVFSMVDRLDPTTSPCLLMSRPRLNVGPGSVPRSIHWPSRQSCQRRAKI